MNKFNAKKVIIDDIVFHSMKEGKRYTELLIMQKAKLIKDLSLQPSFILQDKFIHNKKKYREIKYIADFMYFDLEYGFIVVEDTKGFKTKEYMIKKKLFLNKFGNDYIFIES